ncbi:MAG: galactokinase [Pseudomonadota bacterium]
MNSANASIAEHFHRAFGHAPTVTAAVPGRTNLIGEHIDYNGGTVLPAALDKFVQIALAADGTPDFKIQSAKFDARVSRPVESRKQGDWADYAAGALSKARELGWLDNGAELFIESDVPDGAGASTSAALITAILRAAAELASADADPVEIAQHARAVENDYIGMPCGIMDQMAVGLCVPDKALALNTDDLSYDVIDIPGEWGFLTIHSGVRRELADGRYKARFEECQQAADALGTQTLCLLTPEQAANVPTLPGPLRRRTRHVVSEHERTLAAIDAMRGKDMAVFAQLMNESHRSYSEDFEASTPVVDALVADALDHGAKAARLTGGGFGGCLVTLVDRKDMDAWSQGFLDRNPGTWRV